MIFESIFESEKNRELFLVDGGFCRWHLRRDGQITIREIIVLENQRGLGIASKMLKDLKSVPGCNSIFAKCPSNLEDANNWYRMKGFELVGSSKTKSGKEIYSWRLSI